MGGGSGSGASDVVTVPPGSGVAEGDFATAKTSVWWDIENCMVPRGCDPHAIAKNISTALANMGYKGMVSSISVYGDTRRIHSTVQQALNSTGVNLNHVPAAAKDASDKKILVDMLLWAVDNPPPANYLLISGDRDFSNALHQLRLRRYNILLAHAPNVSAALVAAAQCVWQWTSLVNGGPPLNKESSNYLEQSSRGGKQNVKAATNMKYPSVGANEPSDGFPGNIGSNSTPTIYQSTQFSSPRKPMENSDSSYTGSSFGYSLPPNSMVKEAPHEFFRANISGGSSQSNMKPSSSAPNLHPNSNQVRPLLRPSDLQSSKPVTPSGNTHASNAYNQNPFPQPPVHDGSSPAAFGTANLPDVSRLNISNQPRGVNYNTGPYQQNLHPSNNIPTFPPRPEFRPTPPEFWTPSASFSGNINNNGVGPSPFPPDFRPPPTSFSGNINNSGVGMPAFPPDFRPPPTSFSGNINNSGVGTPAFPPEFRSPPTSFNGNINNNGVETPTFAQTTNEVQFYIGVILRALHILKTDKMTPTESNIADCIHYGIINLPSFNVKFGLDHAIRNNCIVKHGIGASLPLYVGKHDNLWKCVNVMDLNAKHPKTTWDAVESFIASSAGRSALLGTQCRYQAALLLKTSCLKEATIGDALQILNLAINIKKWIVPLPSGWQPLAITLPIAA